MGIQVCVELKDLPKDWEVRYDSIEVPYMDEFTGETKYYEEEYLAVKFPENGWIGSYAEDCLVFDNKNVNHQYREELDKHGVKYTRS